MNILWWALFIIGVLVMIATSPKDNYTPRREREEQFRRYQERKDKQ